MVINQHPGMEQALDNKEEGVCSLLSVCQAALVSLVQLVHTD